jgi:hypothetical protein
MKFQILKRKLKYFISFIDFRDKEWKKLIWNILQARFSFP